jgi:hypothetical protein
VVALNRSQNTDASFAVLGCDETRLSRRSGVLCVLALASLSWMRSSAFGKNPIGVAFDPDDFVTRFRSGASVKELVLSE